MDLRRAIPPQAVSVVRVIPAYALAEPYVTSKPARLTVTLQHGGDLGPGIGQFRISATADDWLKEIVE